MTRRDEFYRTYKPSLILYLFAGLALFAGGGYGTWLLVFGSDSGHRDAGAIFGALMSMLVGFGLVWLWFALSIRLSPDGITVTDWRRRTSTFSCDTDWAEVVLHEGKWGDHRHLALRRGGDVGETGVCVAPAYGGRKALAILVHAWGAPLGLSSVYPEGVRDLCREEEYALNEAIWTPGGGDSDRLQIQSNTAKVVEERTPTFLRLFVPEAEPQAEAADGYLLPATGVFDGVGNLLGQVQITLRSGRLERLEFQAAPGVEFEGFPDPDLVTYGSLKPE